MKWIRRLLVPLMVCFAPLQAIATDMPQKAPPGPATPSTPLYPTWNGWYGGLGAFGETASSTIQAGGATTNLATLGAGAQGVVGYQYRIGNTIGFTEIGLNYTNLGGSAVLSSGGNGSISGPWGGTVFTAVGFNWAIPFEMLGLFAGQSPSSLIPALPNGVTITTVLPYIGGGFDVNQIQAVVNNVTGSQAQITPDIGFGLLNTLSSGGVIDARFRYEFPLTSFGVGPGQAAQKNGTMLFDVIYKL
jgi:hypothetical protein